MGLQLMRLRQSSIPGQVNVEAGMSMGPTDCTAGRLTKAGLYLVFGNFLFRARQIPRGGLSSCHAGGIVEILGCHIRRGK
jgi:hypothetical protein